MTRKEASVRTLLAEADGCSRLSPRWQSDHNDGYTARVKEPAGHGAIELGWSQISLIMAHIMDAIDKSRALAAIARRVGRNLSSAGMVSRRL